MLNSLLIKNFALIKESKLSFKENFISITGETGAGKSIMLEALHLALGGRKARSGIHQDAQKCIIEVSFILKREAVISWFEKEDVDFHEVTFIRRELLNSGRSRSFVNDTPVSLDVVKELSNNLLKIHTQDDHTELNDAKNQLKIVDDYSENRSFLNDYKRTFESWKAGKQDLERLLKKKSEALKNYEFNQFQLKEFESVDLENTHLDEVKEEYEVLKNASEIIQSSSEAIQVIGDNGAMNQINKAIDILKPHVQIDKIDRLINRLQGARIELKDIFYMADDAQIGYMPTRVW
ncbi:MAG: AAA family ATPase, partial [Bacteroidota bacterium]